MADSYLNKSGLSYFWNKIKALFDKKVNIESISLEGETTTLLAEVKNLGANDIHYARFFTRTDGGSANISDKPTGTSNNAGFCCIAYCSRRYTSSSYTYQLICWVQANTNPYIATVTHETTAISWSRQQPTVNNGTLTIQKNGTNVQTFTANQSSNATANITVPTKVSDLTNTSGGFVTYCTCSTAAGTAAKVVTVDSGDTNWVLRKGSIIAVKFTNTNTASNVTLNVNNTGAKSVYYNTSVNTGNSNSIFGYANRVVFYLYDGTNWVWISDSRHDGNDNTYTTAYCSTAAGTAAKTASMTGYVLTANRYTVLTITNANTAASALTLNINGKGAKPLYINGTASSSTNHTLPAGSYIVWYDGTNYYIYNNGEIPRMIHSEEPVSVTPPSASVSGSEITDGSITYAKTATGEFLKLQLSTVDIGEGVSLPPNTLYGVYE